MKQQKRNDSKPMQALRAIALSFPEAQEGIVCEKTAFEAGKKRFAFLGSDDATYNIMVKLGESLAEAAGLAAKEPAAYKVGVHGWVTAIFRHDQTPPAGLLEKWIDESYRQLAPKKLVARLSEAELTSVKKPRTKKRAR